MRKIALLALSAAMFAVPATAQDVTGDVTIEGSVGGRCLFTVDSQAISIPELAVTGSGATAGKLDPATVNGLSRTLTGWCNSSAAQISVEAFPLVNTAPAATGFTNRVDFTATAAANSVNATDTTLTAGSGSTANVGMFAGNVVVTLSSASAPGDALLVAGDYDGLVEVTLSPTVTPLP